MGAYGGDASFVVKPKVMQGFFLKAGGVYSNLTSTVRGGINADIEEDGAGYLVGAGYESSILSDDIIVRIAYSRYGAWVEILTLIRISFQLGLYYRSKFLRTQYQ